MLLSHLDVRGFAGAPSLSLALSRVSRFSGPSRARVVVADAISLGFGVIDDHALTGLLGRWGVSPGVSERDGVGVVVHWEKAPFLASFLVGAAEPVRTRLTLELDPPLFGRIRKIAGRDLRLVEALSGGSRIVLSVGARFFPDWDGMSLELLSVEVGGVSFATQGSERPDWLVGLLSAIGRRLQRGGSPKSWASAVRSWDGRQRRALDRALSALRKKPFSLGDVRLTPDPDRALCCLDGDHLVPLDRYGPEALSAAALVGATFLSGAEILLWEGPLSARWLGWLVRQAEVENSALEQVIILSENVSGSEPIPVEGQVVRLARELRLA